MSVPYRDRARHGGNDIEALPVTFNDFAEYGVHRGSIAPALAELEALGFIKLTERGVRALAAEYRRHNKFHLLTRPWEQHGASKPLWDRFASLKEADAAAQKARDAATKEKPPVRKPY
jgi:DNA-binding transcriptional MocR family regulator